jgi:hypothetical protein
MISAIVTLSVLGHGVPALRHDWWFPADARAMGSVVSWYADGWSPYGFGSVQPYPTFYPLSFLWRLGGVNPNPLAGLILTVFGTSLVAIFAASSLCKERPWYATWSLGVFAAANPWVYNEYHAGHPYMVTAYAAVLALFAEMRRPTPRAALLSLLAACSIIQIEFSALIVLPLAVWLWMYRYYRAFLVLCAFLLPIVIGIAAAYQTIHGMPYGLDWQAAESIHLLDGFLLRGYRFDTLHFSLPLTFALGGLALLALWGCFISRRSRFEFSLIGCAIACAVYASGLSGFFGPGYAWLVLHYRATGLFRELYDLVAFVAIAYLFALGALFRAQRVAAIAGAGFAALLLLPWITNPIYADVVPAASIPPLPFTSEGGEQDRTLLLPAFQPLSYRGAGSGTDPNSFIEPGVAVPLNEWFPSFPVNAALGYAERDARYEWAEALGVRTVIPRPNFLIDTKTLAGQGLPAHRPIAPLPRAKFDLPHPMPLLTFIAAEAPLVSVGDRPDEHATFFGDRFPQAIDTLEPSLTTHDAREAWVDARLDIAAHPEEASAFGGVVTVSHDPLPVSHRSAVLGRAEGRLLDDHGEIIIPSAQPMRWYAVPADAHALICEGRCMLALLGDLPAGLPEHSFVAASRRHPLSFRRRASWLGVTRVHSPSDGVLRYNTRYDRYWLAFDGLRLLPHLRLDTAMNGWLVRGEPGSRRIWIVHGTSALQAFFEWVALLVLGLDLGLRLKARDSSRPPNLPEQGGTS